jgi:hypothetical protein
MKSEVFPCARKDPLPGIKNVRAIGKTVVASKQLKRRGRSYEMESKFFAQKASFNKKHCPRKNP